NYVISNNLIVGNLDSGIGIGNTSSDQSCDNCVITNNIILYNGGNQVWHGSPYHTYGIQELKYVGSHTIFSNNCVYGNLDEGSPGDYSLLSGHSNVNAVSSGATFVNWKSDGSGDYHLAAGSPCINAGTSQGAPPTD